MNNHLSPITYQLSPITYHLSTVNCQLPTAKRSSVNGQRSTLTVNSQLSAHKLNRYCSPPINCDRAPRKPYSALNIQLLLIWNWDPIIKFHICLGLLSNEYWTVELPALVTICDAL